MHYNIPNVKHDWIIRQTQAIKICETLRCYFCIYFPNNVITWNNLHLNCSFWNKVYENHCQILFETRRNFVIKIFIKNPNLNYVNTPLKFKQFGTIYVNILLIRLEQNYNFAKEI